MRRFSVCLWSAACLAAAAFAAGISPAAAQGKYPDRPVKVLIPYGPGGATDIVARLVGEEFQKTTGQPFVVINKPGAFGLLAIDEMVKSPADGYTLMVGNVSTNAITPILYAKKMSGDYKSTVKAVTNLIDVPTFLLVTAANDFPIKTVPELINYAKANPGKFRYGTVGVGSYPHYDMAYFAKRAGDLNMVGLPNKNGAPGVIQDMLRGDAQGAFLNVASTAAMVEAGRIRALAVANRTRLADYPNVPTMQEVGLPDVGTVAWNALFAPAETPEPVLDALFSTIKKTLQSPDLIARLHKQNFNIVPSESLAAADAWLASELKHWENVTNLVAIEVPQ
jgi:tripartite-type tricarboxylate transporter receptor subunit TctC